MKARWLKHFIEIAKHKANMSRDADTKVGAVIVSEEDMVEISSGFNCLARGVKHIKERSERPLKYSFTSHAELSAISNSARLGRSTKGATMICTMFPCNQCCVAIINAGITKIVSPPIDFTHHKYGKEWKDSLDMFQEAEVTVYFEEM
jgi:dCMP deaminase